MKIIELFSDNILNIIVHHGFSTRLLITFNGDKVYDEVCKHTDTRCNPPYKIYELCLNATDNFSEAEYLSNKLWYNILEINNSDNKFGFILSEWISSLNGKS